MSQKPHRFEVVRSSSMTCPAFRTFIVRVYAHDEYEIEIRPIMAIRSSVVDVYHANGHEGRPFVSPEHDVLLDNDWSFTRRESRLEYIMHDEDEGFVGSNASHGNAEIVPCTWPESEDEYRLKQVAEKLIQKAEKNRK